MDEQTVAYILKETLQVRSGDTSRGDNFPSGKNRLLLNCGGGGFSFSLRKDFAPHFRKSFVVVSRKQAEITKLSPFLEMAKK